MKYVFYYIVAGTLLTFIFDLINEFVLRPNDKIKFDWFTRIINIIIWPYILGVFISTYLHNKP